VKVFEVLVGELINTDKLITRVERLMRDALDTVERSRDADTLFGAGDLPLYGVLRYHLGWVDQQFQPAEFDSGKRIRPLVCLLSAGAVGNDEPAVPAAAAIELLHNFTLIHDDIQDRSETRRHRATLWKLWGEGQAINAGDAMFAISQIVLLRALEHGVDPHRVSDVARGFNETALRIVEGQVLDLGFERRWEISVDDYLRMIGRKTAAIVGFSAWSGAWLAGADFETSRRFRDFGELLGVGFQVQDDLLGIWGDPAVTGKPAADDIRRRKKSLPIIALASAVDAAEFEELAEIYRGEAVNDAAVGKVLELLARYDVREQIQRVVGRYHDDARLLLESAAAPSPARRALEALIDRMARRDF
jgi:geranylgeranyl diphosphate synthase type I